MILLLGIGLPVIFIFLPVCQKLGRPAKFAILLLGIPVTTFAVSLVQAMIESPEQRASSNAELSAETSAQIARDCGTTKEQTKAWFATHRTGRAEHVEEGLKCIHEHK
jgi:hypothetical protein